MTLEALDSHDLLLYHEALLKFDPTEERDDRGRWTSGVAGAEGLTPEQVSAAMEELNPRWQGALASLQAYQQESAVNADLRHVEGDVRRLSPADQRLVGEMDHLMAQQEPIKESMTVYRGVDPRDLGGQEVVLPRGGALYPREDGTWGFRPDRRYRDMTVKAASEPRTIRLRSGGERRDRSLNPIVARVRDALIEIAHEHRPHVVKFDDSEARDERGRYMLGSRYAPGEADLPPLNDGLRAWVEARMAEYPAAADIVHAVQAQPDPRAWVGEHADLRKIDFFTDETGVHPIRDSDGYDPGAAGESGDAKPAAAEKPSEEKPAEVHWAVLGEQGDTKGIAEAIGRAAGNPWVVDPYLYQQDALKPRLFAQVGKAYANLMDRLPGLRADPPFLSAVGGLSRVANSVYAQYTPDHDSIQLSENYFGKNGTGEIVRNSYGFHPRGCDSAEGILVHEMGHAVWFKIQKSDPGLFSKLDSIASSGDASGYGASGGAVENFAEIFSAAFTSTAQVSENSALGKQVASLKDVLAANDWLTKIAALLKYSEDQERDDHGRWTSGGGDGAAATPVDMGDRTMYRQPDGMLTRWPTLAAAKAEFQQLHPYTKVTLPRNAKVGECMSALNRLDELMKQFPTVPIRSVSMSDKLSDEDSNPRAFWAYTHYEKGGWSRIALNTHYWAGDKPGMSLYASDTGFHVPGTSDPSGIMTHEFGHALDWAFRSRQIINGDFTDWRHDFTAEGPRITGYAKTNDHEAFAELFTAAFDPGVRPSQMAPDHADAATALYDLLRHAGVATKMLVKYSDDEERDDHGRWTSGGAVDPDTLRQAAAKWVGFSYQWMRENIARGKPLDEHTSALVNAVAQTPPVSMDLWRGLRAASMDFGPADAKAEFEVGKTVDLNLSSWSASRDVAEMFSGRSAESGYVLRIEGGAHALNLSDVGSTQTILGSDVQGEKEWVTDGRFTVVDSHVEDGTYMPGQMTVVTLRQQAVFTDPAQMVGSKVEKVAYTAAHIHAGLDHAMAHRMIASSIQKASTLQLSDQARALIYAAYVQSMQAGFNDSGADPGAWDAGAADAAASSRTDSVIGYLTGLMAALATGAVSGAMLDARMGQYAASLNPAYEQGFASGVGAQGTVTSATWHTSGDKEVCDLCDARDGTVWYGDDPHPYPGDGYYGDVCEGGPNCRCELWYDIVPMDEAVAAGYDVPTDTGAPDVSPGDITDFGDVAAVATPTLLKLHGSLSTKVDMATLSVGELLALNAVLKYSEDQPRDERGRFASGGGPDSMSPAERAEAEWNSRKDALRYGNALPNMKDVREAAWAWSGGHGDPVVPDSSDIRKALATGEDYVDPYGKSNGRLEAGQTLLRAANEAPQTVDPLYRGLAMREGDYNRAIDAFRPGATVDMNLSSWSTHEMVAREFAANAWATASDYLPPREVESYPRHQIVLSLDPGAHAYDASRDIAQGEQFGEHLTAGRFEVVSAKEKMSEFSGDPWVLSVRLRQVGTLGADQLVGTKVARATGPAQLLDWLEPYLDQRMVPPAVRKFEMLLKYSDDELRDEQGRWSAGGGGTNPGTRNPKVGAEAKERLTSLEEAHRQQSTEDHRERGAHVDPATGRLRATFLGSKDGSHVAMTRGWNMVSVHTHPEGGSFSAQDVRTAIEDGVAEMRVVVPDGTWRLGPPSDGWGGVGHGLLSDIKASGGFYNPHFDVGPLAQKYGLDYQFEPRASTKADTLLKYSEDEERDEAGRWTSGGGDATAKLTAAFPGIRTDGLERCDPDARAQAVATLVRLHDRFPEVRVSGLVMVPSKTRGMGPNNLAVTAGNLIALNERYWKVGGSLEREVAKARDAGWAPRSSLSGAEEVTAHEFGHVLDNKFFGGSGGGFQLPVVSGYAKTDFAERFAEAFVQVADNQSTDASQWVTGKIERYREYERQAAAASGKAETLVKYSDDEERDDRGRWTAGGGDVGSSIAAFNEKYPSQQAQAVNMPGLTEEQQALLRSLIPEATPTVLGEFHAVDPEYGPRILDRMDALRTQFPEVDAGAIGLRDLVAFAPGETDRTTMALAVMGDIYFSKDYFGKDGSLRYGVTQPSAGFHPAGTESPEGVATHEFGHLVLERLGRMAGMDDQRERMQPWMSWRMAAAAEYQQNRPLSMRPDSSLRFISGYGRTGGFREAFAELFAAAYTPGVKSDHPAVAGLRSVLSQIGFDKGSTT